MIITPILLGGLVDVWENSKNKIPKKTLEIRLLLWHMYVYLTLLSLKLLK